MNEQQKVRKLDITTKKNKIREEGKYMNPKSYSKKYDI